MKKHKSYLLSLAILLAVAFIIYLPVKSKNQLRLSRVFNVGINVGNKALDFKLPKIDGSLLSLSELQGKLVYLDFWASWCGSCRNKKEIIEIYKEYQDKTFMNAEGFTILSVSLDNNKEAWLKAIETDGLIWTNHVSDLKGWKSDAGTKYKIQRIPKAFLIDGDGVIIDDKISQETIREKLEGLKLIE